MRVQLLAASMTLVLGWPNVVIGQVAGAAQPAVSGRVVEAATNPPIVGARVQIVDAHKDDITHADGSFALFGVGDGTYTLRALRIGYAPTTVVVRVSGGTSAPLVVRMPDAAVSLDAVVTTGTVGPKSTRDVLSPTNVIGDAELDRRLQGTLAATLANTPGVTTSSLGPATARPVVRGLSGNRVVVLEDGARASDMSATSGDHAVAVDPITLKQIEVVRGPMSLLYGSSALGGVINAVREEVPSSRSEHASGAFSVEGSSVDAGAAVGGFGKASLGALTMRAEGSTRRAGNLQTPLGSLAGTEVNTSSAAAAASFVGARGYAGASYRFFDDSYGVPGGFVGGHDESVHIDLTRHVGRAEADLHQLGPFASVKAIATYTDYRHQEIEHGGSLGTRFAQQVWNANVTARHASLGAFSNGAIGAQWQYRDVQTGGSVRTPSTYDLSAAGFAVEEAQLGRLRLQGGLRYDWAAYVPYEKGAVVIVNGVAIPARRRTFGSVSGSAGALYDASRGLQFGTSVSRAYRTPDFNELYSNGPHLASFSFDVGNPDLKQETGIGVDAFARLTRDRLRGEIAVFRNRLQGFVFPRPTGDIGLQGNRPKFQYTGRDAALSGAEGDMEVSLTRRVVLEGTVSYVRGTFVGPVDAIPPDSAHGRFETTPGSRFIPFMPPLTGRAGVRFETPKWIATSGVRFAGRQSNLGDFETTTAGYAVLDASAGVRLFDGRRFHAVTLRIENALDTEYRNHLARTKAISPEAGRNIALVYRLSF